MLARTISKLTSNVMWFLVTSLALVAGGVATFVSRTPAPATTPQPTTQIKLQTNTKTIKLSSVPFLAAPAVEQETARPLTLASADFDEDGTSDVLRGAVNGGVGFVSLYRGNAEVIYPTKRTAAATPFFPASHQVNLPAAPDFIVTGDFNADGHSDVVTAARNGSALFLLAGNGKGEFAEPLSLELNGEVTALAAGEINRVDGLADLAVALNSSAGARVMLLTSAEGAWKAAPQVFALAHSATALEFAQLTRDGLADLAIAAGNELVVMTGSQQLPTLTRKTLSFVAESLAVGRYTDSTHEQIALLSRSGSLSIASYESAANPSRRQSNRARASYDWQVTSYGSGDAARVESTSSRQLIHTRVSANNHDDLLLLDGNQMRFIMNNGAPEAAMATLEGEAEVVAALPLRMNASALQGLVVLRSNQATPLAFQPVPEAVFAVNSTGDGRDANPGDGVCATASTAGPVCTLRAAIEEANATPGLDTVTFNIGAGTQTIAPTPSLPTITNPIILDALTGGPATQVIRLLAPTQPSSFSVLELTSSGNTIRGLNIIANSSLVTLFLNGSNDNFIEGNTIESGFVGVLMNSASRNTIGGTAGATTRNVISGNLGAGVTISETTSTGNRVLGNYIGTDATGTRGNANGVGVSIDLAVNNIIGGTTSPARNVISGNSTEGIEIDGNITFAALTESADGNVIQGNYIGVNAAGTGALGNGIGTSLVSPGITIDGASNTTIGGTANGAGNVIANNGDEGVSILPLGTFFGSQLPLNNAVLGNSIFNNGTLGIDLDAFGVSANDPGDGDTGANTLQNFPIVTSALTRTTGTTITGTLNSTANSTFTLEFFSNSVCDTSGNGEGEIFVARTTVTTNAAGVANFSVVSTTQIPAGRFITATATNASNNTSEFSACRAVQNAVSDLNVAQTVTPNPVVVGNNLTYNVTVTNSGPDDATGVSLTNTIAIPNGQFTFVSATPSQGSCTGTGPIICNLGTILSTGNATVSIVIRPTIPTTGTPPNSVTVTNTATVSSNEQDGNTANNTNATSATVNAAADLAVAQTVTPNPAASGSVVTYTITITNNGPSTAVNPFARFDPSLLLTNMTCTAPAGWSCSRDGNPFFASAARLAPGTAVFTLSGTLACLPQNTTLTNVATVSSASVDANTANNTATLNSAAQAGAAVGTITYDVASTTALQLGPVVAGSAATPPSGTFVLTNTGCLPMNLTTAQFVRAGNTANLSGVDDSRFFSLRLVPASGAEIVLNPAPNPDRNAPQPIPISRTLLSGQSLRFRVIFNPPLPFFAGVFASRDQLLFANQVLPEAFDSRIVFNFITGGATPALTEAAGDPGSVAANIAARVSPAIQIIPRDGNQVGNPATTPLVIMETIRGDFRVRVSLYDANKNATRITYQFFDTFRQPASNPIEVNLTSLLSSSPLLPGQAFTLQQDFSGAAARPDIVYVRVTVSDADGTNVAATSSPFLPALAAPLGFVTEAVNTDVLTLPLLRLDGRGTTPRQTDSRLPGNGR
ncbi:MAG TPA: FG-GAP-like repeat-containing protein [Blastocatellia bacterium]|nr:FG-GAP-like repeat-containing protein [Blastocatellia bacterium]